MKLAVDMLTAFSAAPIRPVSIVGLAIGILGLTYGGLTMVRALMGGVILVAIALIGEYLWRTLDEVRGRRLYLGGATHSGGRRRLSGPHVRGSLCRVAIGTPSPPFLRG